MCQVLGINANEVELQTQRPLWALIMTDITHSFVSRILCWFCFVKCTYLTLEVPCATVYQTLLSDTRAVFFQRCALLPVTVYKFVCSLDARRNRIYYFIDDSQQECLTISIKNKYNYKC